MVKKLTPYKRVAPVNKEELFEMANVLGKYTGLAVTIWISPKSGKEKHGARIKVRDGANENPLVPITISNIPEWPEGKPKNISRKEIKQVEEFVRQNKTMLMRYWLHGNDIDILEFIPKLKKIEKKSKKNLPKKN